ncbi:MAG: ribosome small subunit-dependent GTPase A [Cyclobacteriaceae bacterium]
MTIQDIGFTATLENYRTVEGLDAFEIGRVILEHKERYVVKTPDKEFDTELLGNLRFTAESRYDLPAVGDWVAFSEYDEGKGLIHAVYPRHSIIERKAVGKSGQVQIIATNVDYGLIVQSANRDFNLNRLERYLTICNASKVEPIIVLSKIDLIDQAELDTFLDLINQRVKDAHVITASNQTKGYEEVESLIKKGKTYCLLGSSGVGKSTLLNNLSGEEQMKTGEISSSVNKGKHVTSHRELIVLKSGGILIDNPGMREVGIADTSGGLEATFDTILEYAGSCRFKDCTHTLEDGCSVLEALANGEIDEGAYDNFRKMEKERVYFETDALERKKKEKALGKLIKKVVKKRKNDKY